jgi:hypothetical protein
VLEPDGVIDFDGETLPLYQCEGCIITIGGEIPAAFTFVVKDNKVFHDNSSGGLAPA